MKITNIQYEQHKTYNQLSTRIGKQDLWYRFPSTFDADLFDATCFVCFAFGITMRSGLSDE